MSEYRGVLGDILLKFPNVSESRTYVVMEEVKGEQGVIIRPYIG